MDPPPNQRTIRAPGTIIKPNKPNPYSGYLIAQQRQFRIINPAGSRTISRQPHNQQPNEISSPPLQSPVSVVNSDLASTNSKPLSLASSTSRLSTLKPSGLARPISVREIISTIPATTSSIKQPQSRLPSALSSSHSRLATLRAPSGSATTTAVATTATARLQVNQIEKPRALTRTKLTPSPSQRPSIKVATVTRVNHHEQPAISSTSSANHPHQQQQQQHIVEALDVPTFANDVGQIRRTLEDLYKMLQLNANQDQSLIQENERLRREVADLKSKLRAVSSVLSVNRVPADDSEVQLSSEDGQSDSTAITMRDDGRALNNRPKSSLYFTPMND